MTALKFLLFLVRFQHAAARRRLAQETFPDLLETLFQHAAARRRLELILLSGKTRRFVSTRSRPKAAGKFPAYLFQCRAVSTRSRPKAAGATLLNTIESDVGFNTQPPEGGWFDLAVTDDGLSVFQHAAARRRLGCQPQRV